MEKLNVIEQYTDGESESEDLDLGYQSSRYLVPYCTICSSNLEMKTVIYFLKIKVLYYLTSLSLSIFLLPMSEL